MAQGVSPCLWIESRLRPLDIAISTAQCLGDLQTGSPYQEICSSYPVLHRLWNVLPNWKEAVAVLLGKLHLQDGFSVDSGLCNTTLLFLAKADLKLLRAGAVNFEAQMETEWRMLLCKANELAWLDTVLPMSESHGVETHAWVSERSYLKISMAYFKFLPLHIKGEKNHLVYVKIKNVFQTTGNDDQTGSHTRGESPSVKEIMLDRYFCSQQCSTNQILVHPNLSIPLLCFA